MSLSEIMSESPSQRPRHCLSRKMSSSPSSSQRPKLSLSPGPSTSQRPKLSLLEKLSPSPSPSPRPSQRPRLSESGDLDEPAIFNERVLILVFESCKWDVRALGAAASTSRKLRAVAKRVLWRELCVYRAPRMMTTLTAGTARIAGGWHALAKLLFFCGGCESTRYFRTSRATPGHFVDSSRFSKTSGQSFLTKKCRDDVLYISDPCEHSTGDKGDDVGIYRGVFRGFMKSRTRECLINRQVALEELVKCPYCGARVWSMTAARLIPRKNAARRLGSSDDGLEYFVCLNGHLHGTCWLVPLSSDEGANENGDCDYPNDDGDDDNDDSDGNNGLDDEFDNRTISNGLSRIVENGLRY